MFPESESIGSKKHESKILYKEKKVDSTILRELVVGLKTWTKKKKKREKQKVIKNPKTLNLPKLITFKLLINATLDNRLVFDRCKCVINQFKIIINKEKKEMICRELTWERIMV